MPHLTLIPTQSAINRKLAGFHSGNPLKLNFKAGETASVVLQRFNTYRGPDSQIQTLFTNSDQKLQLPLQTVLQGDLSVFVV
jgi:hypothetical protein